MNWLFVWVGFPGARINLPPCCGHSPPCANCLQRLQWGFIGAPIAITVTDFLLPILLILYVRFVAGRRCWPGVTTRALHNWGPMIWLALPGLFMLEAEYLAFETLTLASSYLGTTHLAAQTVLVTLTSLTFQIPFSVSIAASTRVANLIGATLADAAKTTARVTAVVAVAVGIFNAILLSSLRTYIPHRFTGDPEVIALVANVLPVCAAFQLFDALVTSSNGLLRGLGFQMFGGYVQVFGYYVVAMPISLGTAFGLGWGLYGLWTGVALALGL
jgi:multidrug resistance protein, MATE family